MHDFKYRRKRLYCESTDIQEIAEKVGTPLFIYSHKTLIEHYRKIKKAFAYMKPLICFSMKSNSNLSVCRALVKAGAGLDIVSGGELFKAAKIKADPKKIVYASVGKTALEISRALDAGIFCFNVESIPELVVIEKLCVHKRTKAQVAIRVNPGVDAHTHHYITTGTQANKFGIDERTAIKIFNEKDKFPHLDLVGIHIHIGSQITESGPFLKAIKKASVLIETLRSSGHIITHLNIGGGLGIVYNNEKPQTAQAFAQKALPLLKKLNIKLILEPGRFISGNSGILVTKVLYVKRSPGKNFIIVDAGMNDLMRPSLYEAYHDIVPLTKSYSRPVYKVDVVGPICESGDFLAKGRSLPSVRDGEYLAAMSAGAYGFSMSSNYNSRPRCAEVLVMGSRYFIVRKRESYEDLVRGEVVPRILR
ncbi:diaminopimelate decarboxylase [Candidatus Omnitrophota bacterium]